MFINMYRAHFSIYASNSSKVILWRIKKIYFLIATYYFLGLNWIFFYSDEGKFSKFKNCSACLDPVFEPDIPIHQITNIYFSVLLHSYDNICLPYYEILISEALMIKYPL